jgi:hypothetical protein
MSKFSVCVLLYGDHLDLAKRCLGSIVRTFNPEHIAEIRVGLNAVSAATVAYVYEVLKSVTCPVLIFEPDDNINVRKYPLMRRMFHDVNHPLLGSHVMWFDDDSAIAPDQDASWWDRAALHSPEKQMTGKIYYMPILGNQRQAIEAQAWFRKLHYSKFKFITGGWWIIDKSILIAWDYPWQALKSNGGDSLLGAMLHQLGYPLKQWYEGVWINADDSGAASTSKPRGVTQQNRGRPLWYNYPIDNQPPFAHQDFTHRVAHLKKTPSVPILSGFE